MALSPKEVLTNRAFRARLKLMSKLAEQVVIEQQGMISTAVYEGLVTTTPVLTGKARENWHPSLDSIDTHVSEDVAGVNVTGAPMTSKEKARIGYVIGEL